MARIIGTIQIDKLLADKLAVLEKRVKFVEKIEKRRLWRKGSKRK